MGSFNRDRDSRSGGGRSFGPRRDFGDRRGGSDRSGSGVTMHKAICSNCGNECEVPFRPTSGKPVFCSNCFEKNNNRNFGEDRGERRSYDRPSFDRGGSRPAAPDYRRDFESLNSKLDQLITLLTPEKAPVVQKTAKELKKAKKLVLETPETSKEE